MKSNKYFVFALCLYSSVLFSCKKDSVITSSSAKLGFSTNAVLFDTVFTTVGSTVKAFLVRNQNSEAINISSIKIGGNYTAPFKINVDGIAGTTFSNVKIPAKDSIFVFVTCTLNPNNQNNPLVIEDSIIFTTNGNVQNVYLEAWGQDAYFFKPNYFPASGPAYSIIPSGSIWTNVKPYVIFGYAVDTGLLTINPGTKVYFHNNAVLWVYNGATLIAGQNGSVTNPVIFQGDRLEPAYQTVPGQWGEIWLSTGSKNNTISWSIIKNGTVGIEADTLGNSTAPTLKIDHTIIKSMSNSGLVGLGSYITGDDLLIEDCQYYALNLSLGGRYDFNQCTFANYWSYGQRQTSLLTINNHYTDASGNLQSRNMDSANFYNCLIWGSSSEELYLDPGGSSQFNYFFGNCFIETKHTLTNATNYSNCSVTDPLFMDTQEPPSDNYQVNSNSPAIGKGTNIYGNFSPDLDNMSRGYPSTLGAYNN